LHDSSSLSTIFLRWGFPIPYRERCRYLLVLFASTPPPRDSLRRRTLPGFFVFLEPVFFCAKHVCFEYSTIDSLLLPPPPFFEVVRKGFSSPTLLSPVSFDYSQAGLTSYYHIGFPFIKRRLTFFNDLPRTVESTPRKLVVPPPLPPV